MSISSLSEFSISLMYEGPASQFVFSIYALAMSIPSSTVSTIILCFKLSISICFMILCFISWGNLSEYTASNLLFLLDLVYQTSKNSV